MCIIFIPHRKNTQINLISNSKLFMSLHATCISHAARRLRHVGFTRFYSLLSFRCWDVVCCLISCQINLPSSACPSCIGMLSCPQSAIFSRQNANDRFDEWIWTHYWWSFPAIAKTFREQKRDRRFSSPCQLKFIEFYYHTQWLVILMAHSPDHFNSLICISSFATRPSRECDQQRGEK